jgi:hypothetical protein
MCARPILDEIPVIPAKSQKFSQRHNTIAPFLLDESTTSGTLEILQSIMTKQFGMQENDPSFGSNIFLFHGDQKTIDRIRSAQALRKDEVRPFDSLKWVHPVLGYWHLTQALPLERTTGTRPGFWERVRFS